MLKLFAAAFCIFHIPACQTPAYDNFTTELHLRRRGVDREYLISHSRHVYVIVLEFCYSNKINSTVCQVVSFELVGGGNDSL